MILGKIIHDEVVILAKADAEGNRIHLRTAKERRNDPETSLRIGSATDPEATYRQHGDKEKDVAFGYNAQAYTGAVSDQAGIAALVGAQLEHLGICPPKLLYVNRGIGAVTVDITLDSGTVYHSFDPLNRRVLQN